MKLSIHTDNLCDFSKSRITSTCIIRIIITNIGANASRTIIARMGGCVGKNLPRSSLSNFVCMGGSDVDTTPCREAQQEMEASQHISYARGRYSGSPHHSNRLLRMCAPRYTCLHASRLKILAQCDDTRVEMSYN